MCPHHSDDLPELNPLDAERERRIAAEVEAHRLKLIAMRERLRKDFQAAFGPYAEAGADGDTLDPAVDAAIDDFFQHIEQLYLPEEDKPAA